MASKFLSFDYWASRTQPSENTLLLGLAVSVGLTSGIGVWLFRQTFETLEGFINETLIPDFMQDVFGVFSIVVILALAGLIVGWMMQRFVGHERHHGVAGIMEAVALAGGRLRYRLVPVKTLASILSLGAGASVGPEDPSVQIGANLGSFFGQRLHMSEERMRLLVAAGSASAIAAAFNAPIAGVFFALEVVLGEFTTSAFGVVVLASVIASVFTQALESAAPELGTLTYTLGSPTQIIFYVFLGLVLAPISVLFIRVVYWQHDLWENHINLPRPLETALIGVIVGLVSIFLPEIRGTGREVMNAIVSTGTLENAHHLGASHETLYNFLTDGNGAGTFILFFLLLGAAKVILTSFSLAGGFVGGVFAPTLFVGIMFGHAYGRIVNLLVSQDVSGDPRAYAIAGMAAMMAGVVRAPITAILLVFELTNDYRLILPIMLTTVISVYLVERIGTPGIYMLGLARHGIHLQQGRDVDVMQGVTVGEAMTTPAPTIHKSATLTALRDALRKHHTRTMCVVDDDGLLYGIVTLSDLQSTYERANGATDSLTVGDICTRDVITAHPEDAVWQAIRLMGARDVGRLPVVKDGTREIIGILARHDIMDAYNMAIARKLADQHRAEQIRLNTLTGAHVLEMHVRDRSPIKGKMLRDISWPAESIVASVQRNNKLIVPHGDTVLQSGDTVTIVAAPEVEAQLATLFGNYDRSMAT